ncbi:MAG: response regulator transcription factor [Anaerolineae bacterium]|nr:response regulator transcription factor [Anaerolineae bacterium]
MLEFTGPVTVKILVVEDDLVLGDTLTYNLTKQGYEVYRAEDGCTAIEIAKNDHPDLILLDVMLPGMDGFEVCRVLRQEMAVPIVMLTARTDEVDRVVGLEVGADDYLTKPFSMRELLARIKAQLRRMRMMKKAFVESFPIPASQPMHFSDLDIDLNRCEVRLRGKLLDLKPKEYELLTALALHRGQVLSRAQLLRYVWGWENTGNSRTVDVHIRWLRSKIEADPAAPQRIVTVWGMGYRFEG